MRKSKTLLMTAVLMLASASVFAQSGRVVHVIDGDTLDMLTPDKKEVRVRLLEIDAPERSQAFGNRARQGLAELCAGKQAVLKATDEDRYGRTLARVYCDGVDANLAMVEQGLAWAYRRYAKDPAILTAEQEARAEQRGLWVDKNPTPPWEYRRR